MAILQTIVLAIAIAVLAVVAVQLVAVVVGAVIGVVGVVIRSVVAVLMVPFKLVAGTASLLSPNRPVEPVSLGTPCPEKHCRCGNPASARFCRRCGRSLPSPLA